MQRLSSFLQRLRSLVRVARLTRANDVLPRCLTALCLRDDVVEGELVQFERLPAVCTLALIPDPDVVPVEGDVVAELHVVLHCHDAWQNIGLRPRADLLLVVDDAHVLLEKKALGGILPIDDGKREHGLRCEVGIQHECRVLVQVNRHLPIRFLLESQTTRF